MTDTTSFSTSVNPVEIELGKVYYGRCKWFNSKSGYGFITFKNNNNNMNDIFVHHNSIKVFNEQYKYLVIGEYIQFIIVENNNVNEKHKYYASEVCGIDGGKLMCETRKDFKDTRIKYKNQKKGDEEENVSSILSNTVENGLEENVSRMTESQTAWATVSKHRPLHNKEHSKPRSKGVRS